MEMILAPIVVVLMFAMFFYFICGDMDRDVGKLLKFFRTQFYQFVKFNAMINTKVLLKAMSFMFMPTLAVLATIYCFFFSWSAFTEFITAKAPLAGVIRLVMMASEVCLVWYMYGYYLKEFEASEHIRKRNAEEQKTAGTLEKMLKENNFGELIKVIPHYDGRYSSDLRDHVKLVDCKIEIYKVPDVKAYIIRGIKE